MHVCVICVQRTAQLYCRCSDPPAKLCEECLAKHQISDRTSTHELLPIETFPYIHIPGYAEAYKTRTGRQRAAAIQELQGNFELLEQWRNDLKSMYDGFLATVTEHREQQERELSALHSALEAATQAGIQEADSTYVDPDPVLNTAVAKGIRRFQPGIFRLISTCTNLEDYRQRFTDLVKSAVFEIEMRTIENESLLPVTESSAVKVVKKGTGEAASADGAETMPKNERKSAAEETESPPEQVLECPPAPSGQMKWKRAILIVPIVACLAGIFLSDLPDVSCSATWRKGATEGIECARIFESRTFCNGTMDFDSGDFMSYSGEWVNGIKQGNGVLTARDGSVYQGQWANDTKHGFGHMTGPHNSEYEGSWRNAQRDGVGIEVYEAVNSDMEVVKVMYIGEFSNNQRHGLGVQFNNWVPTYFGFWKSANLHAFSQLSEKVLEVSHFGCKSLQEYTAKFNVKGPGSFTGSKVEIWTFSSSKAIYLNGLIFTELLDGEYLESMKIYTSEGATESSIYIDTDQKLMQRPQFSTVFTKELLIAANTSYLVQTVFSTDNKYLNEIVSPHTEGEVKFEINAGSLELRTPRFLRGLIYQVACEDR